MPPRWSARQGRPSNLATWRFRAALLACAAVFSGGVSLCAQQPSDATPETQLRLRVYCDSGQAPVKWGGRVTLEGGRLEHVCPWGSEPDAGVVARLDGQQVTIAPLFQRRIAAFDVTASGPRASILRLQIQAGDAEPVIAEIPLADLEASPRKVAMGEAGSLQVFRAVDDQLRIRTLREQLIFEPGEEFDFTLDAALTDAQPHSPIDLQADLVRGRDGEVLPGGQAMRATFPQEGPATGAMKVTLPQQEGVYTLRLTARRPAGFMRGWAKNAGKPLAERSFQVVVWDPSQATRLSDQQRMVVEIDPTSSHWWQRMPEWKWMKRVPWLHSGPLGNAAAEVIQGAHGKLVRLPASPAANQVAWQAYPLPIDSPGDAHVLEVEVPADAPQELSLTLFDRDALGRATSLGDSLTAVAGAGRVQADGRLVVRRLFWPKTDSPMLVISNQSSRHDARYARVRVHALSREPHPVNVPATSGERLIALAITPSQLSAAVQATHRASSDSRYIVEDWETYYETARRVADYVQAANYNSAVITAVSAEGCLFPSDRLGAGSGLQREVLATGMADTPRKDLLELLLREFDRRGLRLVVNVRLESALAAVEAARSTSRGIPVDCLSPTGQPIDGVGFHYNPLNQAVRDELLAVVSEVAARCAGRPAFAGLAIDLTPRGHASLPGPLACADAGTVDAFLTSSNLQWPANAPRTPENVEHALTSVWGDAWRRWRVEQMTSLYSEMSRRVARQDPSARLWLQASRLLEDPAARAALRPRLEGVPSLDALLADRGIDRGRLAVLPNLSLNVPRTCEWMTGGLGQTALSHALRGLYWGAPGDAAEYRSAQLGGSQRLASLMGFKARSPFGADRTFTATVLAEHAVGPLAAGDLLSAALAAPKADLFVGGDACALMLDDQSTRVRSALAATPLGQAQQPASQQPLRVQLITSDRSACLLAGNLSPWPLKAAMTIDAPKQCSLQPLDGELGGAVLGAGKHVLPLELGPYDLRVYTIDCPEVGVVGVRTEAQPQARQTLAEEVERLASRDLNTRRPFTGCRNLSFEELTAEGLPLGWRPPQNAPDGAVAVSRRSPTDGQAALEITAGVAPVRIASDPFAPPATRQLAMTFHVRAERLAPDGQLTILFTNGVGKPSLTTIPAAALQADGAWRQFVFAESLPMDSAAPMQIAFEAHNLSCSIDKIELDELTFPMSFALPAASARQRLELVKIVQSARIALEEGRTTDCLEVLDGFWPRFLSEFTPVVQRPQQVAERPAGDDAKPEKAPEVSSRWRSYLPGFLRF